VALNQAAIQKKRQDKQQKRNAKVKPKVTQMNKPLQLLQQQMLNSGEVYDAWVSSHLEDNGMGHVIVSRIVKNNIVMVDFLVDTYCLGVKDILIRQETTSSYRDLVNKISMSLNPLRPVDVAYAKKLVLDAVQYADSVGISPHADYHKFKLIFADVDANECSTKFNFGKDGKPFLISGPHNSPQQIKAWLKNLDNKCGVDGFEYMLGA
jgi:hypothetical protein